tara:strand:+ start:2093 stop:3028 length:936 start_codon:yes stop_codon:yes gene_type:complete
MINKDKKVLIVGGSGFIGSKLIENIYKKKQIIVLDNKKIINKLRKNTTFIKGNIFSKRTIKKIKNVEIVFFFIGKKGGPESTDIGKSVEYLNSNTKSLEYFLNNFENKYLKKIIFLSTEHVYGERKSKINNVYSSEVFPKNYYGLSKLLAEKILYNFYKEKKVSVIILRFPRVIAFGQKNILSVMTRSAIYKKKITINKENTKFNFIHEEDLVSAMKNSLNKKVKGFKILNIFNNSKPQKLIILAKKIKKNIRISEKIKIHEINNPPNNHNPTEIIVSNLLTKKILNWKPKFSLDKIINKQIKYYEDKKYN